MINPPSNSELIREFSTEKDFFKFITINNLVELINWEYSITPNNHSTEVEFIVEESSNKIKVGWDSLELFSLKRIDYIEDNILHITDSWKEVPLGVKVVKMNPNPNNELGFNLGLTITCIVLGELGEEEVTINGNYTISILQNHESNLLELKRRILLEDRS